MATKKNPHSLVYPNNESRYNSRDVVLRRVKEVSIVKLRRIPALKHPPLL